MTTVNAGVNLHKVTLDVCCYRVISWSFVVVSLIVLGPVEISVSSSKVSPVCIEMVFVSVKMSVDVPRFVVCASDLPLQMQRYFYLCRYWPRM